MNRIDALIKGLQILRQYAETPAVHMDGSLFSGPVDHRLISDEDAKELNELGWYTTVFGWAFNL